MGKVLAIFLVCILLSISDAQDFFSTNILLYEEAKYDTVKLNSEKELNTNNSSFEAAYFLTKIAFNLNQDINCFGVNIEKKECSEIKKAMELFEKLYRQKAEEMQLMYGDQIMMADTRFMDLFYVIGLKYFDKREFNYAAEWMNLAKVMYMNDYDYNFYLGTSYLMIEENEKALRVFHTALELKPDDPSVTYNIACLYAKDGQKEDAISWLKKAIELNPTYRMKAIIDVDFENIKNDIEFKKITQQN